MNTQIHIITWKYLFGGGILGLIISSIAMILILHLGSLSIKHKRKFSLRDQHSGQVPRLGGIGLYWGFLLTIFILWWIPFEKNLINLDSLSQKRLLGFCIGGMFAWGIGFLDDLVDLRARWKLLGQIFLSVIAIELGFEINTIQLPIIQKIDLGSLSWIVTIIWIVGIINAINLIDGLDGLAIGLTITALVCFGTFSFWQNQYSLLLLIFVLIGVSLGFLAFNRPKARIFMGDSGSMFLGYILALLSIWVTDIPERGPTSLPILILAVPILDTGFAFFRRVIKGIPFYSADYDHLHHRLIARGFSASQAMIILIFFACLYGSFALMAQQVKDFFGFSFLFSVTLSYVLLYWLEYDEIRSPFNTFKEQTDHKKRRNLLIHLSEYIDDFFEKDHDLESVLKSFKFCIEMAGVYRFEIKKNETIIFKSGEKLSPERITSFRHKSFETKLALNESSWTIDSDFKGNLLENISIALMKRLEKIQIN